MKITKYIPTKSPLPELMKLMKSKYGGCNNFDYFLADFLKSYSYCVDNKKVKFIPIAAFENSQLVGHIALIIDKSLPKTEAFFGFFELDEDLLFFNQIWQNLVEEARKYGIKTLKGPVNGSIWHQYRFIKESSSLEYFKSEPLSDIRYYQLFSQLNPESEVLYYSASREKFTKVMEVIQSGYQKLPELGFEIQQVKDVSLNQLRSIAELSMVVFNQKSWGYTNLTEKEFLELYSSEKIKSHLNKLYLLLKDQQIIGYCGTMAEDKKTLVIKTICLLPEYQGLGLGNALAFKIHLDAQNDGFTKVIYALIREGNQVKNFPQDDTVIFRRYAAFEFKI